MFHQKLQITRKLVFVTYIRRRELLLKYINSRTKKFVKMADSREKQI